MQREFNEQIKSGECLLPFSSLSFVLPLGILETKIKLYTTSCLVVYMRVKLALTLRVEHIQTYGNKVLRRIFGSNRRPKKTVKRGAP